MKLKLLCFYLIFVLMIPPVTGNAHSSTVVPILLYHCIEETYPESMAHLAITKEGFRSHMQALKDDGYVPISFQEYYNYVKYGNPLPEKPIMITFDDGYLSNYEYAYPILKEFQFKATIFIVVSTVGKTSGDVVFPHFTWEQAKEMEKSGLIQIESHTYSHQDIREFSTELIHRDFRLSKYMIDTNLNKDSKVLAYPFGFYTGEAQDLALKAGYEIQCIVGDIGANTKETPIRQLKRLTVWGNQTPAQLLEMIQANIQLEL